MSIVKLFGLFEDNKYDIIEVWIDRDSDKLIYFHVISHESSILMMIRVYSYDLSAKDLHLLSSQQMKRFREIRISTLKTNWTDTWPIVDTFSKDMINCIILFRNNEIWDILTNTYYKILNPCIDDNIISFMYSIDLETYYNTSIRIWKKSEQDIYKIICHHNDMINSFKKNILPVFTPSSDNDIFTRMEQQKDKGVHIYKLTRDMYHTFRNRVNVINNEIKCIDKEDNSINFQATVQKNFKRRKYISLLEKYELIYLDIIDKCIRSEYMLFNSILVMSTMIHKIMHYLEKIKQTWLEASSDERII